MRPLLLAILTLTACAGSPKQTTQPGSSGSGSNDVVCTEVTDTGSMFSHTECKPRDQSQAEKEDAQRFLKQPRSAPTAGH